MAKIKFILGITDKDFRKEINAKPDAIKAKVVKFLNGSKTQSYTTNRVTYDTGKQGYKVSLNIITKEIKDITIKDLEGALSEKFYKVQVSIKSIIGVLRDKDISINPNDSDKKILDIMVKSLCGDNVDSNLEKVKQSVEEERDKFRESLSDKGSFPPL